MVIGVPKRWSGGILRLKFWVKLQAISASPRILVGRIFGLRDMNCLMALWMNLFDRSLRPLLDVTLLGLDKVLVGFQDVSQPCTEQQYLFYDRRPYRRGRQKYKYNW